jgi:hypothetical protein
MKRFVFTSVLALLATFWCAGRASAATGGACPTGANYLSLTSPQTGGGAGSVTLASLGITSCFYVSAAGSDTNSGTSEASPWLHAPGMPACSGTCAATTPSAGNGFIFRGGDSWHKSSGSPGTGGGWTWGQSGSSGSPIYIGVDVTWFASGSFARPIFNEDNAVSTSQPSKCSFPDDGSTFVDFSGRSNVIFDGFEFTGDCTSGGSDGNIVNQGTFTIAERLYIHGWSIASSASDDSHVLIGVGNGNTANNQDRILFSVLDGADSTFGNVCTTGSCVGNFTDKGGAATAWGLSSCWDVEYTIIRHTSQGLECGDASIFHDNLIEYIFEPNFGGRHGNVFEVTIDGAGTLCSNFIAYNNVTRNTNNGVNWWIQCPNYYVFNNVWSNSGHFPPDPNGLLMSPPGASGSSKVTAFVANNTFQANSGGAGPSNSATPAWASGSHSTLQNNHIMDFTSIGAFFTCSGNGNSCTVTDSGGEVFQTTSATTSQGYTLANNWAPASATGATVGKGVNGTAFCSTIPNAAAAAACTSGIAGVTETSNWGGKFSTYPAVPVVPRPSSGAWDAGAYQFGTGASSAKPNPPTGLKAVAQ